MNFIFYILFLFSFIYSQCDGYNNENQCINDSGCEWVEDTAQGNCYYAFNNPQDCVANGCLWYTAGTYSYMGSHCAGGTYDIDNSYCQEIAMPECSEMEEIECDTNGNCDWIEDIDYGSCSSLSGDECNANDNCNWECIQYGWWYNWCYTYGCTGGNYQIDNSYCEESTDNEPTDCSDLEENICNHPLYGYGCEWVNGECQEINDGCSEQYEFECNDGSCIPIERLCNNIIDCEDGSDEIDCENCSELEEVECASDNNCEWVEDIEIGQCSQFDNSENSCTNYPGECYWDEDITYDSCDYPNSGSCNNAEGCYWDCYYGYCDCYGQQQIIDTECIGQYEIDNSYCEESEYQLGDLNQDFLINILDVIVIVDLVLSAEYNTLADMNFNDIVNIQDVIILIDMILDN